MQATVGGVDLSYLTPMLCDKAPEPRYGPEWAAEKKLDGWRFMVAVTDEGVRCYGGRNSADYSGILLYIEESLSALPAGTVLDGELMHDLGFDAVGSVMRSNVPHTPCPGDPPMRYVVFDMLAVSGRNMRHMAWSDRRQVVETLADGLDHVEVSELLDVSTTGVAKIELAGALAAGFEGMVCKRRDSTYVHTRSPAWVKIKPQQTADAEVIGFKPSKTRKGKVGALEVRLLSNGVTTTIKCPSDAAQDEATDHPERWLGKVVEFDHNGLNRHSGVPRHPTRARRRDDLPQPTQAQRRPAPAPSPDAPKPSGWSKRNYGAMHDEKLMRSISELEGQYGEAFHKVEAKGASVDADLQVARNVARSRGLV